MWSSSAKSALGAEPVTHSHKYEPYVHDSTACFDVAVVNLTAQSVCIASTLAGWVDEELSTNWRGVMSFRLW